MKKTLYTILSIGILLLSVILILPVTVTSVVTVVLGGGEEEEGGNSGDDSVSVSVSLLLSEEVEAYRNQVLKETEIPIKTMRPTHVNRRRELLEQGFEYAKMGGIIDLTCGIYDELSPKNVVKEAENKGVLSENITISSDGYGSWSKYDENGNLIKIGVSSVSSLYKEFKAMVNESEIAIDRALSYFTSNVAKALEIYPKKGCIAEGSDADMIIFNNDFCIDHVIANGRVMVEDGKVLVYGSYE